MKKLLISILAFSLFALPATIFADKKQNEVLAVQKLTPLDNKCAKFDKNACSQLLTQLASLCKKNNSFACFRIGEIASINSEVASKQGLQQDAVDWLDISVGSTKKACNLKLPQACTQMKIFKEDFQKSCKKGDDFFCKASKKL